MNLSMRWLGDYVTLDEMTPRAFAEAMTMSGSKVEVYEKEGSEIEKVIVGKILSIVPHPDSDHMVITQVDVGAEEKLQIVTGANNLKVGDIVPVAVDGEKMKGSDIIRKLNKLGGENGIGIADLVENRLVGM